MTDERKPLLLTDEEIDSAMEENRLAHLHAIKSGGGSEARLSGESDGYMDGFDEGARFARDLYEAEITKLLAEIERLKGMVPRWVEKGRAAADGVGDGSYRIDAVYVGGRLYVLWVPPIPPPQDDALPEKGSGE